MEDPSNQGKGVRGKGKAERGKVESFPNQAGVCAVAEFVGWRLRSCKPYRPTYEGSSSLSQRVAQYNATNCTYPYNESGNWKGNVTGYATRAGQASPALPTHPAWVRGHEALRPCGCEGWGLWAASCWAPRLQ